MAEERREYSNAERAAVLAALLGGQGLESVAEEYKIPLGTVKSWNSRMRATTESRVVAEHAEEIGPLLLGYLHDNLTTLREQVKVFSDPEWLREQNAADVAVLHGVMTDKAIRLLEAMASREQLPAGTKPSGAAVAVIDPAPV